MGYETAGVSRSKHRIVVLAMNFIRSKSKVHCNKILSSKSFKNILISLRVFLKILFT